MFCTRQLYRADSIPFLTQHLYDKYEHFLCMKSSITMFAFKNTFLPHILHASQLNIYHRIEIHNTGINEIYY
jgi:hypothetical protein